jgi:hypothetical protein
MPCQNRTKVSWPRSESSSSKLVSAGWQAVQRPQELGSGDRMEQGNLWEDAKARTQVQHMYKVKIAKAFCRGGSLRSTDETSVMEMEERE